MAKMRVLLLVYVAVISSILYSTSGEVITVANLPFQLTSIATKLWPVFEDSVLKPKQGSKVTIAGITAGMYDDREFFGCKDIYDLIGAYGPCSENTKYQGLMEEFQVQTKKVDFVCKNSDKFANILACTIGNLRCLDDNFPIKEEAKLLEAIQGICKHKKAINCYAPIGKHTMSNPLGTCINTDLITGHEIVQTLDNVMEATFQCNNKDQMAKWWHCQQGQRLACLSSETQEKWRSILPTEQHWREIIQFQCDNEAVLDVQCGMFNWYVKCGGYQIPAILAGVEKTPCEWMFKIKSCISVSAPLCSDEYIEVQKQIIDMVFCGKRYKAGTESGSSSNKESGSSSNKTTGSPSFKKSGTGNNKINLPWLIVWPLASYIGNYVVIL